MLCSPLHSAKAGCQLLLVDSDGHMSGDPRIPTIDRGVSIASDLIATTRDEASTNTHTRDRSSNVPTAKSLSKRGDVIASRYELRTILGVGAYGEVFAAWDRVHSRVVAIKILRNTRANVLMQFKQEFRGVFELNHPNLVRVHKLGRDGAVWFIVMELIDGVPITNIPQSHPPRTTPPQLTRQKTHPLPPHAGVSRERVESGSKDVADNTAPLVSPVLPLRTIQDRIGQLSQGTHALHALGILHCDLKPSNVMVNEQGRVVILDFGASRYTMSLGAHYKHHWIRAGTRAYMAPEARRLPESTHGLDWYSIGVMLAEMLTGLHARVISSTPPNKRIALLEEVASTHVEYADMCELCVQLIHPTPRLRAGYLEVIEACYGDSAVHIHDATRGYTPEFGGRDEELSALARAYAIFRSGRPHTILVEGDFGSGKNAVCGEFLRRLSLEPDAPHILVAHCKHDELLSYRAFDGVVDGLSAILRAFPADELTSYLPSCTPTLCSLFPTLRTVHPSLDADSTPLTPQDALFALQALLKRIAEHRRLVIWVSSVEQADRDSLRWIARIFAPGQRPNVFLLLSRTPRAQFDEAAVDIDTLGYAIPTIALQPLDERTANDAITFWLPQNLKENTALINAIRVASGGRLRTMRALSRFPDSAIELPDNISVDGLLERRISVLPKEALHLLYALAVSFNAVDSRTLAFVAKRHPINVDKLLQDLQQTLIVQRETNGDEVYELIDEVLRRRVLQHMDEALRQYFHGRYATAGTTRTISSMRPADIVAHLRHANRYSAAARYALKTAEASDQGGAYDSAAQMYGLVLELHKKQGISSSAALRLRAVECNLHSGRLLAAARLLEQLAKDAENPIDAATFHQRAAETLLLCGHNEEEQARAGSVYELPPEYSQHQIPPLSYITLLLERIKRRLNNFDIKAATDNAPPPDNVCKIDTHRMVGFDIGIVNPVAGFVFALRGLKFALDSRDRIGVSRALSGLSTFVSAMGGEHQALALQWADLAIELAQAANDRTSLEWAYVGKASATYYRSNYSEAWTKMEASHRWIQENTSQQWVMLTYSSFHLLYLAYMTGRIDTLRTLYYAQIVEARARSNRMLEITITFTGFITWLIDDAPAAGRAVLERAQIPSDARIFRLHDFFVIMSLVELALYEQRTEEFRSHIKSLKDYEHTAIAKSMELTRMTARFLRGRLRIAHAVHTGTMRRKDMARLRSLARSLCKSELVLAQGWGLQLLAALHFLQGEHERAATHLIHTVKIYEAAGISLYVEVIRAAARVTGLFRHDDGNPYHVLEQMGVVNPERFIRAHHPYI